MACLITAAMRRRGLSAWRAAGCTNALAAFTPSPLVAGGSVGSTAPPLPFGVIRQDRRGYRHRGVLKLHCSECRYVIRRWHVPILAVDCNANPRHKQALTNPPPRSRWTAQFADSLAPWVEGKQYPRWPHYRMEHTFVCYHNKKKHLKLR
mmetsp:Transcript_141820/g.395378  ORF Transcript_141820/g.395378 Transcript_141820/m.395378 type:complete len:150 (-) Transcript_141820:87-536(-)